ncbi:MAG: hypothetical protein PHP11_05745 [Erysipelotrichaceae bacterium]|nr:hypothetical protein [Erysipelotrichaceae bacterium]
MNKKTLLKVVLALLLTTGLYFAYQHFFAPKTISGDKNIQIIVEVYDEKSKSIIYDEIVSTNAEFLSELLLELDQKEELKIILSGSENDPYGRSLVGINDHETIDWSNGPWWLYESENNLACKEGGYCPGIDSCPLYDQDIFTFKYTNDIQ